MNTRRLPDGFSRWVNGLRLLEGACASFLKSDPQLGVTVIFAAPGKSPGKSPGKIEKRLDDVLTHGDLTHASAHVLKPLMQQARLLSRRYDAVVANPPYMGSKFFSPHLKEFIIEFYKDAKADLYSCFIQQNVGLSKKGGLVGMITIPNWMFLSSFEGVRGNLLERQAIDTFVHNGRGVFADAELTPEQAKSLEAANLRSPARVKTRELPSRKRT